MSTLCCSTLPVFKDLYYKRKQRLPELEKRYRQLIADSGEGISSKTGQKWGRSLTWNMTRHWREPWREQHEFDEKMAAQESDSCLNLTVHIVKNCHTIEWITMLRILIFEDYKRYSSEYSFISFICYGWCDENMKDNILYIYGGLIMFFVVYCFMYFMTLVWNTQRTMYMFHLVVFVVVG